MSEKEKPTHKLECAHAIGLHRKIYYMDCIPLKTMPDGRIKVKVFGDRYWSGKEHLSRIRYVQSRRVMPNSTNHLTEGT